MHSKATLTLFLSTLFLSFTFCEDQIVKVRIKNATFQDLSSIDYPIRFSQHRGSNFFIHRKGQWLYGILSTKNDKLHNTYQIELPELGRLIYNNPDTGKAVILDQVEYHHPSFVFSQKSYQNLENTKERSLTENLEMKEFIYQTLIGDVKAKFEIRVIKNGKDLDYVRALRFNAPRKKKVRQILQYKNIL